MLGIGDEDDDENDQDHLLIMPENWDSVQVFQALSNCWRVDGFNGRYLGIERPAIESTLRLMELPAQRHREIFEDLRIMENAALESLNRER